MTLSPVQIDKVIDELRSFLRAEVRSKKIKKLDPSFYKNVTSALDTLKQEAEGYLVEQDITNYITIKERSTDIERDFKALFQRRFEKIATLSIYDLDSELMNSLTPEEKEFIVQLHNMMQDQYNVLLNKLPPSEETDEKEPRKQPEEAKKPESPPEPGTSAETVGSTEEKTDKTSPPEYVMVRITGDQPPIAQPDRDYYLHENDVVYLPEEFAEILIGRKAAIRVNAG